MGDSKVTIKGDPSLTKAEISLKMMTKTWSEVDQGFLIELRGMNIEEPTDKEVDSSQARGATKINTRIACMRVCLSYLKVCLQRGRSIIESYYQRVKRQ